MEPEVKFDPIVYEGFFGATIHDTTATFILLPNVKTLAQLTRSGRWHEGELIITADGKAFDITRYRTVRTYSTSREYTLEELNKPVPPLYIDQSNWFPKRKHLFSNQIVTAYPTGTHIIYDISDEYVKQTRCYNMVVQVGSRR